MEPSTPPTDQALDKAAEIAITQALAVQPGERVVIITNPDPEVDAISRALYRWVLEVGGRPNLVWQQPKTQLDPMDEVVRQALLTEPEVYISLSKHKIGKDLAGVAQPYLAADGTPFDSIGSYLMFGKKCTRGFWSPGITRALFAAAVPAHYPQMQADCAWLAAGLAGSTHIRVTSPGGTELTFGSRGRKPHVDDGDFRRPGTGGNLPAGETYLSPLVGSAEGRIVFDGSMSTNQGTLILYKPITVEYEAGFITQISGGLEAEALAETIREGEDQARALGPDKAEVYRRNARGLGELGIGVNPLAGITGAMIVDEKASRTCHFAVGSNYDHDGPALIHLDGLVKEPTIEVEREDGSTVVLVEDGVLVR